MGRVKRERAQRAKRQERRREREAAHDAARVACLEQEQADFGGALAALAMLDARVRAKAGER